MEVYSQLSTLPIRKDFPYREPSELREIQALRPAGPRVYDINHSESVWRDKFYGAWLGRLAGCALGKPLETDVFMSGSDEAPGWRNVQRWFEGADAWPIQGYTPEHSRAEQAGIDIRRECYRSTRECIKFMESDDDVRYTVLGLVLLEEKGLK